LGVKTGLVKTKDWSCSASGSGLPEGADRHSCLAMNARLRRLIPGSISFFLIVGCASVDEQRGPQGTIAYYVKVEASDGDVRIEANEDYVGKAPLTLKIFGDKDGTFHNFGSSDYVVRAIPSDTNLFTQAKVFRTGGWFSQEDRIPKAIYFDMKQKSGFTLDLPRY
jgi:hypothetical protein